MSMPRPLLQDDSPSLKNRRACFAVSLHLGEVAAEGASAYYELIALERYTHSNFEALEVAGAFNRLLRLGQTGR